MKQPLTSNRRPENKKNAPQKNTWPKSFLPLISNRAFHMYNSRVPLRVFSLTIFLIHPEAMLYIIYSTPCSISKSMIICTVEWHRGRGEWRGGNYDCTTRQKCWQVQAPLFNNDGFKTGRKIWRYETKGRNRWTSKQKWANQFLRNADECVREKNIAGHRTQSLSSD